MSRLRLQIFLFLEDIIYENHNKLKGIKIITLNLVLKDLSIEFFSIAFIMALFLPIVRMTDVYDTRHMGLNGLNTA